jgi:hypothetical protein
MPAGAAAFCLNADFITVLTEEMSKWVKEIFRISADVVVAGTRQVARSGYCAYSCGLRLAAIATSRGPAIR